MMTMNLPRGDAEDRAILKATALKAQGKKVRFRVKLDKAGRPITIRAEEAE